MEDVDVPGIPECKAKWPEYPYYPGLLRTVTGARTCIMSLILVSKKMPCSYS